jgi:hypothetical protein
MLKKILITFLIVPVLGGAIYGYFYFKQVKTPLTSVLKAIPQDALCITEARDFTATWKSFSANNTIWKELLTVDAFSELNLKINFFDSVFVHGNKILKIDDNTRIYLSAHADTANGVDFLLAFNIPLTAEKRAVNDIIEQAIPVMYTKSDTLVAGIAVHQYKLRDGKKFYYYLNNTVFALSYSPDLIEKSARTLVSDLSLLQNKSFTRVLKTAGNESEANVFVNFKNLSGILPNFLNAENIAFIQSLGNFAQWLSMDLSLKNDVIMLNGFTYSSDSAHDYLSLFKKQQAPEIQITSVLPINTAFFSYTGLQNTAVYLKELRQFNRNQNEAESNDEKTIKILEKKYGIDLTNFFATWVGNEMVAGVTESYGEKYNPDYYAVFKANDINKALKSLDDLQQSIVLNTTSIIDSAEAETYRSYPIKKLAIANVLPPLFGKAFQPFKQHWYTAINNYIVMAETPEVLRSIINFNESNRTLKMDRYYNKFAENLSAKANFFIYSAVARSQKIYAQQLDKKLSAKVNEQTALFRKFQSLAIQFTSSGDLFYNNLCLKYNPVYKPEFNTLWETAIDTNFIMSPQLVLNTSDSSDAIFIQDELFNVYLYDNKGKELWKQQVDDKIIGAVHQIHSNKNGQYRLVFNTAKHLYMINEEGKFPENYPVTLKANATTGVGYFNFDENKNPLILVACDNLSIYNYKINGTIDTDFKTDRLKDTLKADFKGFTCDGRDMICFIDEGKNLRLIDKKGNWIIKFKEPLPAFHHSVFYVDIHKTVNASAIILSDENGTVYHFNFKGKYDVLELLPKVSPNYHFTYGDVDNDGTADYIFADNNKLNVLNKDRSIKFDCSFNTSVNRAPQLVLLSDSITKLAVSTDDGSLFIFDSHGSLNRGTSLLGQTPVTTTSINNKRYFFIITAKGKTMMAHAVDNDVLPNVKLVQ